MSDDVYTIPLSGDDIVLTRYLHVKNDVVARLVISILNKSTDAFYWAFELIHSGFEYMFFNIIRKIYDNFFATLNLTFGEYLEKQRAKYARGKDGKNMVYHIISILLARPYTTDVFMLRTIVNNFDIEIDGEVNENKVRQWLSDKNCLQLAKYILEDANSLKLLKRIITINNDCTQLQLLSQVLVTFYPVSKRKALYRKCDIAISDFDTISENVHISISNKHSSVLLRDYGSIYNIFYTHNDQTVDKQHYNWLYHAGFSPVWHQRIRQYRGWCDYTKETVCFINDDYFDKFHDIFGYNLDEQPNNVRVCFAPKVKSHPEWGVFCEKYLKSLNLFVVPPEFIKALNEEEIISPL